MYLDDNILVYSKNPDKTRWHMREVLQLLRDNQLFAKTSKCDFGKSDNFLGHLLGADGLRVNPQKTAAVRNWPVPADVSQLNSFLGLANYFRKLIERYAAMALPLTNLTRGDVKWNWTAECQAAFENVQPCTVKCPRPCLFLQAFKVVCDPCGCGLGGVLYQGDRLVALQELECC